MNTRHHTDDVRELRQDLTRGRLTRFEFITKATAMGLSLTAAYKLLEANPVLAMTRAERELKGSSKTFQYWTPFSGDDGPHMKLMVDKYNANHQGAYFNFIRVGGGYETKMTSAAISHTLPDVAAYRLDWIPDAVARGIFEPIDDIAAANHIAAADYAPAVWLGGLQNGHRYSIPLDTHVMTFYYNKDIVSKAGVSGRPSNKAQFMQVEDYCKKNGLVGFPVSIAWPADPLFATFLWQNGGQLFTADHSKVAFNSAEGVKALTFLVSLVRNGYSPKGLTDDGFVLFSAKKAAMYAEGIWQLQGVKDAKVDYWAGPMPQIFDKPATWSGSHQMVLPTKSRASADRQALGQFITYITSNSAEWARGGQVPANARVRASAAFQTIQPQATIAQEEPYVHFVDTFPGASQAFYGPAEQYAGLAINGKMSVQAALNAMESEANKLLASARAAFGQGNNSD